MKIEKEEKNMSYAGFFKGMTTGLIIGAAVTMLTDPVSDRQRRKIHKKTEGIFRDIGGFIDTAMDLLH